MEQQTTSQTMTGGGSDRQPKLVNNPGNPVFTCGYPPDAYLPKIGGKPVLNSAWSQGYGGKPQHPMYTTTSKTYGSKAPSVCTVPTQFYAKTQKFSEHLGTCGMYRNYSLNTETDKSKV